MINRRSFLAATGAAVGSTVVKVEASSSLPEAISEEWLAYVRKSEAALFLDVNSYSRTFTHFDRAGAYLEGEAERRSGAVVVIGLHGSGLAHGLHTDLWTDWDLSSRLGLKLTDATKSEERFRRWLSEVASQYPSQVWVLACSRTLRSWATERNPSDPDAEVTRASKQIVFGVSLVSSMISASAHAQHAGAAYQVSRE